jgi:hypothetical protein
MNKSSIELKHLTEIIPPLLLKKFEIFDIHNLQQVSELDPNEFAKKEYIGKKVVSELMKFQKFLDTNFDELIEVYESNTKTYTLPIDYSNLTEKSIIEILNETLTDYLNLQKDDLIKGIISHFYGINSSDIYTLDDLASYYNKSNERIRQLKEKILFDLDIFLQGKKSEKPRLICESKLTIDYLKLKEFLRNQRVLSFELLNDLLVNHFSYDNKYPEAVKLIIDLFSFEICGKVETRFTKAEIVLIKEFNKKKFIKTADEVLRILKKEVTPLNEMQLIINCKRKNKEFLNLDILKVVEVLPEIEIIESSDIILYQVKFEFLSRASDRAYRVLLENSETMYIDNIVSEINKRLVHSNTEKIYDRHSLALASDKRFLPQGKTGFWGLKIWNTNSVKIETLIKKALYQLDKPSKYDDIYLEISKERPNLNEKSVRALIGRDCLKVENDCWILPEWKQKYTDLAFLKRKKREVNNEPEYRIEQRTRIFEFLQKKENHSALASEIIKSLKILDKRFTRISFYKMFDQDEYFIKTLEGKRNIITLKQFEKNINFSIDEYNWTGIKDKLNRDLKTYFSDTIISPKYPFDLNDSIQLYYLVINKKTSINEFDGMEERILGNLNKYYFSASDRTDKLNYLKQFLTCLDPFLKKILFFVDNSAYNFIVSNKKGLGEIFDKLSKLDPTKERFKEHKNARKINFGKQIQTTYFYRNNDTHSANEWTELEIANAITSCLVVYIFSCCEYYTELRNKTST